MKVETELQRLKDKIIALPHEAAEVLADWLSSINHVRREDKKRAEIKKPENQK